MMGGKIRSRGNEDRPPEDVFPLPGDVLAHRVREGNLADILGADERQYRGKRLLVSDRHDPHHSPCRGAENRENIVSTTGRIMGTEHLRPPAGKTLAASRPTTPGRTAAGSRRQGKKILHSPDIEGRLMFKI